MTQCDCPDWDRNMRLINSIVALASARSGVDYYKDGKEFVFCPWCGKELKK